MNAQVETHFSTAGESHSNVFWTVCLGKNVFTRRPELLCIVISYAKNRIINWLLQNLNPMTYSSALWFQVQMLFNQCINP